MKIIDFVSPNYRIARSVNLERDRGHKTTIEDYQITSKGIEILRRFLSSLNGERVTAWSLTGPYGMGKSAFVNFLLGLTGKRNAPLTELAREKLKRVEIDLEKHLSNSIDKATEQKGFFNIPITASFEPLNISISKGIIFALSNNYLNSNQRKKIKALPEFKQLSEMDYPDNHIIIRCLQAIKNKLRRPIIVVIDELGKNLEFMAHYPEKGDIFILQLLAESIDIYLWVCLHQSFEGYASGLTNHQKQEWNKVQGRFEDISFLESTSQMLSLISSLLIQCPNKNIKKKLTKWAISFLENAKKDKISIVENMSIEEIVSLYPIHPIAAVALPELCRKFAQNDRTLFSFICSGDPNALPEFLKNHVIQDDLPFLGINHLYDYFFSVSTSTFINRPEAQRWIEIQSIIDQSHSLSPIKQAILKTIGVLNLISSNFYLTASPAILRSSLKQTLDISKESLNNEILSLSKNILIFREYAQEYRLWEGSDFNIIDAIENKKAIYELKPLQDTLQKYSPLASKVASRHSYKTGTLRRFECKWMDIEKLLENDLYSGKAYDGLIVYAFGNQNKLKNIPSICSDGKPLVVIYCAHKNQIKELILEAAATKSVLEESSELINDGVARKETRYRAYEADNQLRRYIHQIYFLNSAESHCFVGNEEKKIQSSGDLSLLLSELCEKTYSKSPAIKNEMINYNKISSSAARARRQLAEAMVTYEKKEMLGMKGNGPEVALYRTLFLLTGLHQKNKDGWKFVKPNNKNEKLLFVWNFLIDILNSSNEKPQGINIQNIINELKKPPFGMREGVIPIFLCHYLIINADEIALYQEGAYKPYFGEAEISLLIKRPELFSLKRFAPSSIRRDVIKTYFEVLNSKEISLNDNLRNTSLLKIVSPLLKFVDSLPKYSRLTRRISLPAQKLRSVLLNSSEPISLLFKEIPEAIGLPNIDFNNKGENQKDTFGKLLESAILDLDSAYDELNKDIKKYLMEAFGWDPTLDNFRLFRAEMHKKYLPVFSSNLSKEIKSIAGALVNEQSDDNDWARSIAGLTVKKPVHSWYDSDIEPFRINLFDIADRIQSLRKLVFVSGGFQDNNSVVISFTGSEGKITRRLIHLDVRTRATIEKEYTNILNQPEKVREALCFILSESLKENK